MMERRVRVAVPAPFRHPLDYLAGELDIRPGHRLLVPLGRRQVVGVALESPTAVAADGLACRPVLRCLDPEPLVPPAILELCRWAADYYSHPIGEVLAAALPASLRVARIPGRRARKAVARPRQEFDALAAASQPLPTPEQQSVLAALRSGVAGFSVSLIEGVTGSGKTEVYLRWIADAMQAGGQAMVLTPEIGLTPQLLDRFRQRFGDDVGIFHSGLTEAQRRQAWLAAADGRCRILVGTRSAVFVPMPRLAMIVVDEEHDVSYKQQEGFRYSARDSAIMRARQAHIPVLLGSATPALETLHNARRGRYRHWRIDTRVQARAMPNLRLADMRGLHLSDGLSPTLLEALHRHTAAGGQALMFVNRRGYAPALLCHECGWVAPCTACDARMTLHRARGRMICHHCGNAAQVPLRCEQCSGTHLVPVGQGTERLEDALRTIFPRIPVERFDSDRVGRAGELERLLGEVRRGRPCILVGTQMLAKGHDFPRLSLVGVVDADAALFSADFRALERMGQLLTQVSGRAGRGDTLGEVILQTHQPQHPRLQRWLRDGYRGLADELLEERRMAGLPPFGHLALIRADALDAAAPLKFLQAVADRLGNCGLEVMGPVPAPMERRASRYRVQLLLRSTHRQRLQVVLKEQVGDWAGIPGARRLRWSVDVDPVDLY